MNSVSVSLGILMINWDAERKDYLSGFLPLIDEAIRRLPTDAVADQDVQEMVQDVFGLHLPLNVIASALKRSARYGNLDRSNGYYVRSKKLYDEAGDYLQRREKAIEANHRLASGFIDFAKSEYDQIITTQEAEDVILSYLDRYSLDLLRSTVKGTPLPASQAAKQSQRYIFARYVEYIEARSSPELNDLLLMVRASMLATSVYLPEVNQPPQRRWSVNIYLDTPLLIQLLGFNGIVQQAPTQEMVNLATDAGAKLFCFRHNLLELQTILRTCAHFIENRLPPRGRLRDMVLHFIETNMTPAYIRILATQAEDKLRKAGVSVEDRPDPNVTRDYQLSESGLEETLQKIVGYRDESNAINIDIQSVVSMHHLWRGKSYSHPENVPSLFVSENSQLVKAVRQYYQNEDLLDDQSVIPIIDDHTLSTYLWLRQPAQLPDLPRQRIMADCYAATLPSEALWDKYVDAIDGLQTSGEISTDDLLFFKCSPESTIALMDVTLGEHGVISRGTATMVINRSRDLVNEQVVRRAEEAESKNEKQSKQTADRRLRMKRSSEDIAKRTIWLVKKVVLIFSIALFVISAFIAFPHEFFGWNVGLDNRLLRLLAFLIVIGGIVLQIMERFMNLSVSDSIQNRTQKWEDKIGRALHSVH